MILDPNTDRDCLGQLTKMARELAPTTLMMMVARRLGTPANVVLWLQSLPQTDDNGDELLRYIACDVPQRVRLLPDDPNCFERTFAALALLETLDPKTQRMAVTIDRPVRHTGVVERRGAHWVALDLFPRRNFDWGNFGKDVLQGTHQYVGKPLLSMYGLGSVANTLGENEDKWIGRDKKNEKKEQPPSAPKQSEPAKPQQPAAQQEPAAKQQPAQQQSGGGVAQIGAGLLSRVIGSGAQSKDTTSSKGGGDNHGETKSNPGAAAAGSGEGGADRDGGSPFGGSASQAKRWGGWG